MPLDTSEEALIRHEVEDFTDFLAALNNEGVAYVVIGGIAVLAHIPYRTTRDIDVLIEPTLENARRAHRAVGTWGDFEVEFAAARSEAAEAADRIRRLESHPRHRARL